MVARNDDDLGDERDVLLGRRTVEIGDRVITIREMTGEQTLAHEPLLMDLASTLVDEYGADDVPGDALLSLLARRPDDAFRLLAISTGESAQWLRNLPGWAVDLLLLHWVGLHIVFFAGRLERVRQAVLRDASGLPSASRASSATDTQPTH